MPKKNVHKVNRWFILPFENKMFVVINIVCIYYQKKILGNRKSFLIWQCYTKKGNIKVSKNTKKNKQKKKRN